jgi:putative RecB family exonuclease
MERPVLSSSQVNAYLACPLKYRFQYVDRIERPWRASALVFGTSVHAAVEWFHRARMAGASPAPEEVLRIFEGDWYAQNTDPLVFLREETAAQLMEKGRAMLRLYLQEQEGARAPVAVEQPFEIEIADPESGEVLEVRFRGFIDLIEADGTLVDLKTAGRALEAGGLERHLQLSCYALAVLLQSGRIPPLRLDMLFKTARPRFERLSTSRTTAELSWTARLISEVAQAIETEHFFPNPSWRCTECEYFAHCLKWRGEASASQLTSVGSDGEGVGDAVA